MAEVLEADVSTEEAPASPSSVGADHPAETYITRDEFNNGLNWVANQVREAVTNGYRGTQKLFATQVNEVANRLGVSQQEAVSILEDMAEQSGMEPERLAAAKAKARAVTEAVDRQRRTVEERAEVEARAKAAEDALKMQGDVTTQAADDAAFNALWHTMVDIGDDEGLDEATVKRVMPKARTASAGDERGYKGMAKAWRAAIRAEATRREKEATPGVVSPERGAGTGNSKQTLVNKLAWGETLSPDEFALASKYMREEDVYPEPNPQRRR